MNLGDKHFNWTVKGFSMNASGKKVYNVQCDCGHSTRKRKDAIINANSKRCIKCVQAAADDIKIGDKYSLWTIIEKLEPYKYEHRFLCRCKCGRESTVRKFDLKYGKSKSCRSCILALRNTTHSGSKSPTYSIWGGIKQRCSNPKNKCYRWYGGRGISFDIRWNKYENFLNDMGVRPEGLSIDRINPDGNYTKENCRWVPSCVQASNRRNSYKNRHKFVYVPIQKLCSCCKKTLNIDVE